jgi:hypothetical protein
VADRCPVNPSVPPPGFVPPPAVEAVSGPPPAAPPGRRPRPFRLLATGVGLVALAAVALVLLGLTGSPATDPIAQAATVSSSAPGYKMNLSVLVTSSQLSAPISASARAVVDPRDHAASMTMAIDTSQLAQADSAPAHPGGGQVQLGMVLVGQDMYMKFPPAMVSALPGLGGKPWIEVSVANAAHVSGLSSLGDNPAMSDPQAVLQELRSVANGVIDEGHQQVDGVLTTHYAATVSLDRLFGNLSSADKAVLQQLTQGQEVPIDVWIDAHRLVRRVVMTLTMGVPNGPSMQETATADITDYGPQPRPTPPPADQVTNASGLLAGQSS